MGDFALINIVKKGGGRYPADPPPLSQSSVCCQFKNCQFSLILHIAYVSLALRVTTRIVPVDNQPPRVIIKQPLTVREAGIAKLSQQHIIITDPDTRESDITCRIDVQPTRGYLENVSPSPGSEISNSGKRITSFGVGDILNDNLNYVQDKHRGVEPRVDWVALSCMDTNNTSPRYLLNIIILPTNDEVGRNKTLANSG